MSPESFELADTPLMRLYWMAAGFARGRTNLDGMRVTLERIKAVTESTDPSRYARRRNSQLPIRNPAVMTGSITSRAD